jgi:inosine-uridine nucleoside N-ribohydrolase
VAFVRWLAALLFTFGVAAGQAAKPIPIIFDTDIGDDIDDALALALVLQSPELDVRAVTTVVDDTETRTRLALKQLKLYNRGRVPLGTGASEPLLDPRRLERARQFEVLTDQDELPAAARKPAAQLIVETLRASAEKITLVPVGPLTNIALALKLDPGIRQKIDRIVLMGGAFFPARREYNIYRDRIAAEIVFRSGIPIVAVGLDVTEKCKLQGEDLDKLKAAKHPAPQLLVRLIELWQNKRPEQYPTLHDPLAVAALVKPSLIETQTGTVQVETSSPLLFGTTVFRAGAEQPVKAARDVRVREFLDLFTTRLAAAPIAVAEAPARKKGKK